MSREDELQQIRQENQMLRELVKQQHEALQQLQQQIVDLQQQVSNLQRQGKKDSHNSHQPPSTDRFHRQSPKSLRKKSDKSVGGQPGHQGRTDGGIP